MKEKLGPVGWAKLEGNFSFEQPLPTQNKKRLLVLLIIKAVSLLLRFCVHIPPQSTHIFRFWPLAFLIRMYFFNKLLGGG